MIATIPDERSKFTKLKIINSFHNTAMNHFYGYIRVSTVRQGEGVSLQQQRAAIEQYAQRHSLKICQMV